MQPSLEHDMSWKPLGACIGMDPDMFFPPKGPSPKEAKAVCARCPVRQECLDYSMEANEKFGVWGGLTERERRILRSERWKTKQAAKT